MGPVLTETANRRKPALDRLHARIQVGGDNLWSSADGHERNDERVSQDFEKTGTDTSTQAPRRDAREGPAERGVLEAANLRDLQAIGRRLGGIDADSRAGRSGATPWPQIRRGTKYVLSPAGFSSRRRATGASRCRPPCAGD